jgi:two-component system sensor histidine kinase DegS
LTAAPDWAQALLEAGGELQADLEVLRERAADAAIAQTAAEEQGERRLADAYAQEAESVAAAVACLQRLGERLRALRELPRVGDGPGAPGAPPPAIPSAPAVSAGLIEAQEEERRRLARDIHDGPAQLLANVVFRIDVAQTLLEGDIERARAELEQLKQIVRHSLQDVRKIIFDLRPLALDDLGLVPALRSYLGGLLEKAGLKVDLEVAGEPRRLPTAHEAALFRLVQEALHNVRKHAGTDAADVRVEFADTEVRVAVTDHGRGFDPAAAAGAADRLGLRSMRERAELFGGSLTLRSTPGGGTVVEASVPVPVAAAV